MMSSMKYDLSMCGNNFLTGNKIYFDDNFLKNCFRRMKLEQVSGLCSIRCGRMVCVTLSKRLEINFEYYRCRGAPRREASTLLV